ncbi:TIGR03619 family F420-dependent LLM class oxidoreductase [Phytohabitans kaempferiae]|uniref:TIGR03619 family F420-dependent LLM class oxidoreductase n=1 Tax=Phytohabitans kaempferiae TaxID=1620943 RepID=A0ABV6LZ10_9ACTN
MTAVRLSLQLFGIPAVEFPPLVELADARGFDTVWLADHVITPVDFARAYPYNADGDPGYRADTPLVDVAVTLSFLAARTRRIKLGTGVFILPLRNPFHVARAWGTLHDLSGGRAVFGIGTGWMAEEFAAVGADFGTRGRRTDEMLDVLDLLWSGQTVEYAGEFHRFAPVRFGGAPHAAVPIVVGGHADRALRRAATRASGWFGPAVDLPSTLDFVRRIDRMRAQAGREHLPFTHYVRIFGDITVSNVERYRDAGLEHLVFAPFTRLPRGATAADRLAAVDEAADRLAPVLAGASS